MKYQDDYPNMDSEDESRPEEMESMDDDMMSEEDEEAKRQAQLEAIEAFGHRLQQVATDCVSKRSDLEKRWIEDLRQFNGMYDEETQEKLKKSTGSKLFLNITRPKSSTAEARLGDMLFPTDEKNWGIKPTPVPELDKTSATVSQLDPNQPIGQTPEGAQMLAGDLQAGVKSVLDEAKEKASAMETEISDQLEEAKYTIKSRDAIHDAIVYGTGILKGPFIVGRTRKQWVKVAAGFELQIVEDLTPTVERVDIWDFFPDMSATRIEDAEFVLQRHYLTKKQLRKLAKIPGFNKDCIEDLLGGKAMTPLANYREELRSLSGITGVEDNRYEVWEYHGSVEVADLQNLVPDLSETDAAELEAIIFFCQGKVLKATINPMDTEERPYSVFNWEEDDSCIFGFGVPYLIRTPQKAINGSFRMVMDNGGLSSGPQIVVNTTAVQPIDGNWSMSPRKTWKLTDRARNVQDVFGVFEVNSHLNELIGVLNLCRQMADELVNLPLIAQGDQAPHLTQTAKGMSILMNAANGVMRRAVKCWDDDITKPMIERFYDWNMQYSEKEEIKGDLMVAARGTSALLEREAQTDKLLALMNIAPAFGPMIKMPVVARKLVQSMSLPSEELIASDEEMKAMQSQPQKPDPETMKVQVMQQKIQMEAENNQMDFQTEQNRQALAAQKMQLDAQDRQRRIQLELEKLAQEQGISYDELRTELGIKQMDIQSNERRLAAEIQVKQQLGSGI